MLHHSSIFYRGEVIVENGLADSHASGGDGLTMLETLFKFGNLFFGIERLEDRVITFQFKSFQAVGLSRPVDE